MGLFKKQVNEEALTEFLTHAYKITFDENTNGSNTEKLIALKEMLPVLKGVKQRDFNSNLVAVTISIMDISWDRYLSMKPHDKIDAAQAKLRIRENVKKAIPKIKNIDYLIDQYGHAFRESSITGYAGNGLMAEHFLDNVLGEKYESYLENKLSEMTEAINTLGDLLGEVFNQRETMIKSYKLLS
jgi:hypothetical protein